LKQSLLSNRLFLLPIVLLLVFIGLAPLLSAVFNSFFHDIYGQRSWAGLDNYGLLLADQSFFYSLRITLVWATLATLFSLFLGYIFALKLVNLKRFSPVFYIILLIPWGIPAYIAVPLWRALLHGNGGYSLFTFFFNIRINLLTDQVASFIAALLVSVWMTVPLTAFVFVGMIRKIPRSMLDAARIDGADANDIGFNIYLPHMGKAVLVMGILNFIKALKEFTVIFLMTAGGPPLKEGITASGIIGATSTLEVVLYEIFSETRDFGIPAAYSVIMMGLVVFFMVLWITIRRKNKSNLPLIIFTAASQVLLGGIWGLVFCLGYIISIKWKKAFFITFAVQFIVNCILVGLWGFLRAFDCGLIISLICLLIILRNTPRSRSPGIITLPRFIKYAFSVFSAIICIIVAVLTLLIVYLLVWMSISRVNACYMDTIIPSFTTFNNFINIFTKENVMLFFLNTLVISLCTAFLIPFICLPGAAFLSRISFLP
jgi:multiple sugar transport system permease protein